MSPLPASWCPTPLAAVSSVVRGITFPASEKQAQASVGYVACLRTSNVQKVLDWRDIYYVPQKYVKRDDQYVQPGDVLMSMANSYELVGKVARAAAVPEPAAFGAFLAAVRPTSDIDGRYIYHYLRSSHAQSRLRAGSSQTTNIANISATTLGDLEIPLAPLGEQRRIADKLDTVLARVDAVNDRLARVVPLLKRLRQSVLAAATSGRLTEDWRQEGRDVPWTACDFGDLLESSFYGPRFSALDYTADPTGIPTIRTTDMTAGGRIELSDSTPCVMVPEEKLEKFLAKPGDLLVTRTGSIGVMALFELDRKAIPSAYLIRFRFLVTVLPRFAYYLLAAPDGQRALGLSVTAITQPNVNAEAVKRIPVEIPGRDEQEEIVRRVELLFAYADRLEARLQAAQTAADRLTPALLAKAFRGELVPQDPNDEPASELLKRLAAQRARGPGTAAPGRGRGRKPIARSDQQ